MYICGFNVPVLCVGRSKSATVLYVHTYVRMCHKVSGCTQLQHCGQVRSYRFVADLHNDIKESFVYYLTNSKCNKPSPLLYVCMCIYLPLNIHFVLYFPYKLVAVLYISKYVHTRVLLGHILYIIALLTTVPDSATYIWHQSLRIVFNIQKQIFLKLYIH